MKVTCKRCKGTTRKLKRANPVLEGRFITHHYCPECKVIHMVLNSSENPIVVSRPLQEGDRVEGERFVPWYCRS